VRKGYRKRGVTFANRGGHFAAPATPRSSQNNCAIAFALSADTLRLTQQWFRLKRDEQ
jgi:hypothetical protein